MNRISKLVQAIVVALFFVCFLAWANEPAVYVSDMTAFIDTIDTGYPFFDLKGVRNAWEEAKPTLIERSQDLHGRW